MTVSNTHLHWWYFLVDIKTDKSRKPCETRNDEDACDKLQ